MILVRADDWLSKCVRERAAMCCERCGHWQPPGWLDCSHFITRDNWAVRFDADNVFAHCRVCHGYLEDHRSEFEEWVQEKLGPDRYAALIARSQDIDLAKRARQHKAIATHYKDEYHRMMQLRRDNASHWAGITRIEFENWSKEDERAVCADERYFLPEK